MNKLIGSHTKMTKSSQKMTISNFEWTYLVYLKNNAKQSLLHTKLVGQKAFLLVLRQVVIENRS